MDKHEIINQIKNELNNLNVTGLVNMTRILVIISKLDELEKAIAEGEQPVKAVEERPAKAVAKK